MKRCMILLMFGMLLLIYGNSQALRTSQELASEFVSEENSSTTALALNATFTGTSTDIQDFNAVRVAVFANQASAAGGLSLQFSQNGTNWDFAYTYSVSASTGLSIIEPKRARYFRVVYTNGGLSQTTFRLTTSYGNLPNLTLSFALSTGADKKALVDASGHIQADVLSAVASTIDSLIKVRLDSLVHALNAGRLETSPILGQNGVAAGQGNKGSTTLRFTIALDDTVNKKLGYVGQSRSRVGTILQQLGQIGYVDSLLADLLWVSGQVDSTETLTLADTEYEVTVPSGTRGIEFNCSTAGPTIRWSYATGKVATPTNPYNSLLPGLEYYDGPFTGGYKPSKIYFASSTAGTIVQIRFKK